MIPALWVAFGVLALLDFWCKVSPRPALERLVKPGAMLALIGIALLSGATSSGGGLALLGALVLCLLGDVLLLGDSDARFLGGLGAFLAGHVAYAGCFLLLGLTHPWWAVGALVAVALILPIALRIIRGAATHGGAAMGCAVTAYIAVIVGMTVLGWATGHLWVGVGAAIFVVSDTILGFDRFVRALRQGGLGVMVTYLAAQAILTASVLAVLASR